MLRKSIVFLVVSLLAGSGALADAKTKKLSGKIRSVKDNVLRIEKSGLVGESYVMVEMDKDTRITGQVLPGLHIVVKYREGEKDSEGERRKIAVEIETQPEFASKDAKKAAKQLEKKKQ